MCDSVVPSQLLPQYGTPHNVGEYSLGGVGLVMHHEKIDIADVVDEESLVAGRHHVAGPLIAAIADL